jgi:hypothetical protein
MNETLYNPRKWGYGIKADGIHQQALDKVGFATKSNIQFLRKIIYSQ